MANCSAFHACPLSGGMQGMLRTSHKAESKQVNCHGRRGNVVVAFDVTFSYANAVSKVRKELYNVENTGGTVSILSD